VGDVAQEIVVLVTASSEEEAVRIGRAMVERELAACVNVLPRIRSIFRWEGKVSEEQESLLLMKSRDELFEELSTAIKALHSYTVPEIIALRIEAGSADYLQWVRDVTSKPQK
jgi:periplasmic divalent cation tolerance protein